MEGADRVGGQLRGDKECPFSGVTSSGRVWRKVPESDARSVSETASGLVNKVAQTLNAYYTESVFTHGSIEHAYSVGKHGRGPRPVIVCFRR